MEIDSAWAYGLLLFSTLSESYQQLSRDDGFVNNTNFYETQCLKQYFI